jgi:hypothetical protein
VCGDVTDESDDGGHDPAESEAIVVWTMTERKKITAGEAGMYLLALLDGGASEATVDPKWGIRVLEKRELGGPTVQWNFERLSPRRVMLTVYAGTGDVEATPGPA